jgi:hypothetical protein
LKGPSRGECEALNFLYVVASALRTWRRKCFSLSAEARSRKPVNVRLASHYFANSERSATGRAFVVCARVVKHVKTQLSTAAELFGVSQGGEKLVATAETILVVTTASNQSPPPRPAVPCRLPVVREPPFSLTPRRSRRWKP